MAKSTLPVNFKDDIMNSSMGGLRRYKMINNSDGTVSFEDATSYDQVGSNFGAGQVNATNQAVNAAADAGKIIDDMDAIRNVTQEGYIAGALALKRVDNSLEWKYIGTYTSAESIDFSQYKEIMIIANDSNNHSGFLVGTIPVSLFDTRTSFVVMTNGLYVNASNYATPMVTLNKTGITEINFLQAGQSYNSVDVYVK